MGYWVKFFKLRVFFGKGFKGFNLEFWWDVLEDEGSNSCLVLEVFSFYIGFM